MDITTVDEFIAAASVEAQSLLLKLRKIIKTSLPNVIESIGYKVPQYNYQGKKIGISVAKSHVTIGFEFGIISDSIRNRLESGGYKLGLQTIQIKFKQDIPEDEIVEILNILLK